MSSGWTPPDSIEIGGEPWSIKRGVSQTSEGSMDSISRTIAVNAQLDRRSQGCTFFHELHHVHSAIYGVCDALKAILVAAGIAEDRSEDLAEQIDEIYARVCGQAEYDTLERNGFLMERCKGKRRGGKGR